MNLIDPGLKYQYAPVHTEDVSAAVEAGLNSGSGIYDLSGSEKLTLKKIMDSLETAAGKKSRRNFRTYIPLSC